jgi:hypothetical protein
MSAATINLPRRMMRAISQHALVATGRTPALECASPGANSVPLNLPDSITDWLARLSLLYGVPFEYLVPDIRLLPVETIRFFYIDPNWILRAIDGALSIGTTSSRDNVFNETFYQEVYAAVQAAIPQVRQTVQGSQALEQITVGATTTGFLFRSAVVSGYPGIEIVPTYQQKPVPILRLDRLSNDIMLALFNGLPDHIEIRQPPEGLHFGITRATGASTFSLYLRWLGHSSPLQAADVAGNQIDLNVPPQQPPIKPWKLTGAPIRTGESQPPGVIDVTGTTSLITTTLGTAYLGPNSVFTSAEFAVEMVLSAGVQSYDVKAPTKP